MLNETVIRRFTSCLFSFRLTFSLVFICAVASAQPYTGVAAKAHEYIDSLTSPAFKGRGYTSDGGNKAANYIRSSFNNVLGTDSVNTKFQPFLLTVNTFPGAMDVTCDKKKLTPGKSFILKAFSQGIKGKYRVEYFDISKVYNPFTKVLKIECSKNAWLCFKTKELPEDLKKSFFDKLLQEKFFGAKGVIEITDQKLTMDMSEDVLPITYLQVREDSLNFIPNKINIALDQQQIEAKTQNVIARVKGTTCPDSFLVVTGHYDHLGELGNEVYFPGANDNASGISMLLTLAEAVKQNPLKYTVVFITFSGEEIGLLGSKYFVYNPAIDLKKIKFLVNIDIAGTGDDGIKVVNGAVDTVHFNILKRLNDTNSLLKSVQPRGKASISDHYFFTEAGVPSFFIYTLGGISAYHDVYDRPETLPLTDFNDLHTLLLLYLRSF